MALRLPRRSSTGGRTWLDFGSGTPTNERRSMRNLHRIRLSQLHQREQSLMLFSTLEPEETAGPGETVAETTEAEGEAGDRPAPLDGR